MAENLVASAALDTLFGLNDDVPSGELGRPPWTSGVGCGVLVSKSTSPRERDQ